WYDSSPPPTATTPASRATAVMVLSLVSNMAFTTPSDKAATLVEKRPAAAWPAATRVTAWIVADNTAGGTLAETASSDNRAANAPPDRPTPFAASRVANILRARATRLATVPSGQPSCRAASLTVLPSRSHRTITVRYFSGNRLTS